MLKKLRRAFSLRILSFLMGIWNFSIFTFLWDHQFEDIRVAGVTLGILNIYFPVAWFINNYPRYKKIKWFLPIHNLLLN